MSLNETLSQPTVLSLSRTIAENKTAYYKAFDVVERPLNGSEATPFVAMILDLVEQAQDAVLSDLAEKRVQLDDLKRAIDELDDTFTERAKDILFYAAQMHIFGAFGESTLDGVSGYLDVTKPTASRSLSSLIAAGIFRKSVRKAARVQDDGGGT